MNDADAILAVNEIYPAFQGEGRNAGMPCVILRLAGCNLHCSWCDTRFAWDWSQYSAKDELRPMTVTEVYEALQSYWPHNLVISGGEPMLQQRSVAILTERLHAEKWHTEIETAGTIAPKTTEMVKQFNVSPKLCNSGNAMNDRLVPDALRALVLSNRAIFKFVVKESGDFLEVDDLVRRFAIPYPLVYIMPEGTDAKTLNTRAAELADDIRARGYNLAQRLHVLTYGHKRGV